MKVNSRFKSILIIMLITSIFLGSVSSIASASKSNVNEGDQKEDDFTQKVELVDERTQYSKTFLNEDGTTTVTSSTYSLNYFDAQALKEIDTTIREDSSDPNYTHSMLANKFKVRLNNKSHKQSVTLSVSDDSVTYYAKGMNSVVGSIDGNKITYKNAWKSTDLQYQVENDQLKMYINLANNTAPKTYSFEVVMKNVGYKMNPDGSIDFINKNGEVAFQIPQLWVMDASGKGKQYDRLKVSIMQKGNNANIKIALNDQGLQYPIIIDPTTTIPVLEDGNAHVLNIKSDGTVFAWGNNSRGQLGDGSMVNRATPVQVKNLTDVIAVAAGNEHSLALKQDGTVWAWGSGMYGEMGDGSFIGKNVPVQVKGLDSVVAIAARSNVSFAIKQDGTLWAWGYNNYGKLGNGTFADSNVPKQVSGLTNVKAIALGRDHSIALKQDGTVWSWGSNKYGQLGNGTYTDKSIPVQLLNLSNIVAVAAGQIHSMAIKNDGTVWSWGENYYGQLGIGTNDRTIFFPVQVNGLMNVVSVATFSDHSLALKQDGTVWSWGANDYGQLGDGTTEKRLSPLQVNGLTNIVKIKVGSAFSTAIKQNGTVYAWGNNSYGQLGVGVGNYSTTPIIVSKIIIYNYDNSGRLASIVYTSFYTSDVRINFVYDSNGNLKKITKTMP
ncbi:hypothetical protein D7Z26_12170 [Cohnella endophytica]|uniref:RCC1 repeat-containing protein n=1 Tax=Cohnella endophytica TaxID=2419778 RepID=A0A494XU28_9BACL|nr:hypothetical protein [Cohnella endophytica]RKP54131.1 hypothetical protein D7Z26_12170 [Cohnella endophytica]